ncbi:Antibiotic biosynthesis monooxygenase [Paramixta manurensis]|uniref:Antibiotic biosynthesis monooxygenase n=1 Tax=Paramixta manurensis TaxID=2740817 RepID=A0A6M8UC21_9GAMM|nr:Antibiotic biosynthesis monooxygenase [Erwiniaceae bacterium PD-1]
MQDKNILVVAKLVAQPGKAEELKRVLSACVAPSRAEDGNLHYDLYRSVEDGNVFLFHERWKNAAAVETHNAQPHFKKLIADSEHLLKQPPEIQQIEA